MPKHGLCNKDLEQFEEEQHGLFDLKFDQETIDAFKRMKDEMDKTQKRQKAKDCIAYWATIIAAVSGVTAAITSIISLFR